MDDLFGLSMNLIMWVLLGALGVALSVVLYVILQARVMFFIGIRNMPRRIAQTTLIIVGLMLSTLIISAAFTTGDTVDRSLTAQAYRLLGHADAWVMAAVEDDGPPREIDTAESAVSVERLREALEAEGDPSIDGFLPILREEVPVVNPRAGQSEPSINFVGLDTASLEGFPDVIAVDGGAPLDVAALAPDEVYMNKSAADDLAVEAGDVVQIFVQGELNEFTVVDIAEDKLLTGVGDFDRNAGMVARLDSLQALFDRPGEVNFFAISNDGGVRDGLAGTDTAIAGLDRAFIEGGLSSTLRTDDVKRDLVEGFQQAGNFMTTFFLAFGLFSIAAGMLLIVMIFVMLAAERKSELGMARAVGTRRGHLIQMFMSEGMAYNVLS
ncbi:MAG: FtsX-like permease family protein, partial [Dehalococcoidia bacterium]